MTDRVSLARVRERVADGVAPPYMLVLVEVAEAARAFDEHVRLNGGCHKGCPEHDALAAALSDLDFGGRP